MGKQVLLNEKEIKMIDHLYALVHKNDYKMEVSGNTEIQQMKNEKTKSVVKSKDRAIYVPQENGNSKKMFPGLRNACIRLIKKNKSMSIDSLMGTIANEITFDQKIQFNKPMLDRLTSGIKSTLTTNKPFIFEMITKGQNKGKYRLI